VKVWFGTESLVEVGDELAIELHGHDRCTTGQEAFSEGTVAGTDFDDGFASLRPYGLKDAAPMIWIDKEVLTEWGLSMHSGHVPQAVQPAAKLR
jgi:hypothetical protein